MEGIGWGFEGRGSPLPPFFLSLTEGDPLFLAEKEILFQLPFQLLLHLTRSSLKEGTGLGDGGTPPNGVPFLLSLGEMVFLGKGLTLEVIVSCHLNGYLSFLSCDLEGTFPT